MHSFALAAPGRLPGAFRSARIDLALKLDVEGDLDDYLETHRDLFMQPSLEDVAAFAAAGAFGCEGPVEIELALARDGTGRVSIEGRRCTPLLLSAVLNLMDQFNRRGDAVGPYTAMTVGVGPALAGAPEADPTELGAFPAAAYADLAPAGVPQADDAYGRHGVGVSFPLPSGGVDAAAFERLSGLYEFLHEYGIWVPRADYDRWAAAGEADCEATLSTGRGEARIEVRDHLGPAVGVLDLMRAVSPHQGGATVTIEEDDDE